MHTCMHTYIHTHIHTYMHVCVHACIFTCITTCTYILSYIGLRTCMHAFIYIYIYTLATYAYNPHIVIVNSRFLQRPQKRSRRNQLIHRRLTETKSTGSGQDPESQAGRQSDAIDGGWCLELRRGGRYEEDGKSG